MTEIYKPRAVSHLGLWAFGDLQFKVYGLLAEGQEITADMVARAQGFVREEVLPAVAAEGADDGLGFVILHPGELGVTTSVHWWIQGSVLCQRNHRQLYGAAEPMDTKTRPAVACVWELALINAEQEIWRRTMMVEPPSEAAYLKARADFEAA